MDRVEAKLNKKTENPTITLACNTAHYHFKFGFGINEIFGRTPGMYTFYTKSTLRSQETTVCIGANILKNFSTLS